MQNRKAPLYYMFSGPDFLYANAFFPEASTYLMSGLETVGPVPTVSERTIAALPRIQSAIGNSVKLSFFITSQMGGLQSGDLPGALPIILVYAVRSGKTIEDITLISLDHEGNIQPPSNGRNATPGVKITVRTGDGPPQTIYYFRTDVSNTGVSNSGFLAFAGKLGQGQAFFKSASYLVHGQRVLHGAGFCARPCSVDRPGRYRRSVFRLQAGRMGGISVRSLPEANSCFPRPQSAQTCGTVQSSQCAASGFSDWLRPWLEPDTCFQESGRGSEGESDFNWRV